MNVYNYMQNIHVMHNNTDRINDSLFRNEQAIVKHMGNTFQFLLHL